VASSRFHEHDLRNEDQVTKIQKHKKKNSIPSEAPQAALRMLKSLYPHLFRDKQARITSQAVHFHGPGPIYQNADYLTLNFAYHSQQKEEG
jgi:hypothetical protein